MAGSRAALMPATHRTAQPIRLRIRGVVLGRLGRLMAGVSVFELGNVAATLLILRATDLLSPGQGQDDAAQIAIALYILYNLAATLVSIPAGRLGDRRGMVRVLASIHRLTGEHAGCSGRCSEAGPTRQRGRKLGEIRAVGAAVAVWECGLPQR